VHKSVVLPAVSLRGTIYPPKWRWTEDYVASGCLALCILKPLWCRTSAAGRGYGFWGRGSDNPQLFDVNCVSLSMQQWAGEFWTWNWLEVEGPR